VQNKTKIYIFIGYYLHQLELSLLTRRHLSRYASELGLHKLLLLLVKSRLSLS